MVAIGDCPFSCESFDLTATLLKWILDSCCCKNHENKTLWIFRMVIGLVFCIIEFIVICVVNNGDYLDNEAKKGLFGTKNVSYAIYFLYTSYSYVGQAYLTSANFL